MSYTIRTKMTWSQTMSQLEDEFKRWSVSDWETNYPRGARLTGWYQEIEDRTVTLRYVKNGQTINLKYGAQQRAVDNLRALYLTINDMRMTEVRGVSDLVESAYKQLGSGSSDIDITTKSPYEILGIREDSTLEVAEAVYRTMAKKYHPDSSPSGSVEMFQQINLAIEQIRNQAK